MSEPSFCFLCGTPIEGSRPWPDWMRRFRSVYTEDALSEGWDPTVPARLSGLGRAGYYSNVVPVDDTKGARKIHISLSPCRLEGPIQAVPGPSNETARGYPIHDHCWQILVAVRASEKMDVKALLDVLRSFPTQGVGILNLGHDYGGAAQYEDESWTGRDACRSERSLTYGRSQLYPHTDPLKLSTICRFRENAVSFHAGNGDQARLRSFKGPTRADVFSVLPEETLSSVFRILPSAEVASLRRASRVCARTPLHDSFWRTRFEPGCEFDYIAGAMDEHTAAAVMGRWRSLYLLAKVEQDSAEMANRRRVWGLALSLRKLIDTAGAACLQGEHAGLVEGENWVTASRTHCTPDKMFTEGSRSMWARTVSVSAPTSVYASCVDVYGARYVSGIRLKSDAEEIDLGYIHNTSLISESIVISGLILAQSERGIRGLSVLSPTGSSHWAGDHENIPKRRLVLPPKHGPIHHLRGGFDGIKLVTLSISDGGAKTGRSMLSLRDSATWYPDIPDPHYSILGVPTVGDDTELPVTTAIFGGRDGESLDKVSAISFRFDIDDGEGELLLGLRVSFTGGLESVVLGVETGRSVNDRGDAEGAVLPSLDEADESGEEVEEEEEEEGGQGAGTEEGLTFSIDGGSGERIVGIDEIYRSKYASRVFRFRTNRGRSAEFPPPVPEELGTKYHSVKPIQPKKGVVVGFCSRVSPYDGLGDIGLVCAGDSVEG